MEILEKNCIEVTIKFSLDEARALKEVLDPGSVSSSDLESIRRTIDLLTDKIDSLDCDLARKKEENTVLIKNVREDLETL